MRIFLMVSVWIFAISRVALSQDYKGPPWFSAKRCTQKDADESETTVDRLKDWGAVYRAFKRYRQCDDGAVAEGYSDAVAKLFADRWQTLPEFAKLVRSDRQFERFVFWHIDDTVNMEDDQSILAHARGDCPAGLKALCRRLETAVKIPAGAHP